MERYEKYKDSGIEWIGEIPEHWKIVPIKRLVGEENTLFLDGDWIESKDIVFDTDGIRYITTGNIGKGIYKEQGLGYITQDTFDKLNCTEVLPFDLVISRLNPPIGRCCIIPDLGKKIVTSVDNVILRPNKKFNKGFLKYVMSNEKYFEYTSLIARGATMQRISRSLLGDINIPVSFDFNEQSNIATFLDRKTSEIDRIIANKQKLIALYEEEKQAIINQAVTKGLDPNVNLKDSGVEWLGEIPEHWEVKKLNYCFDQIGSGTTPTSGKPEYYENGEFNWLQTGDLNDSEIIETSKKITQKALDDNSTLRFYPLDSIVIAMYGATIGKTGILKIESTTNQACCVLSKPRNIFPKFVFYWFNAVKKHIISLSYGGGQPNINQEQIRSLKIQQPPIDEQKNVVEYIENELSRLSVIIEKFNKQIDLLQEYRTTLISEVVTGKIKVPNTIEA